MSDNETINLYTIGFARHSAEEFFELLKEAGIERIVDIRLRNTNQIAGFTKKTDLQYFLKELMNCEYYHFEFLAPTAEILDAHRKGGPWSEYVEKFIPLMKERKAIEQLDINFFKEKHCCLLCSEHTPDECHRRLVSEMMKERWPEIKVTHLINLEREKARLVRV